jgi:hypothetical protein
LSNQIPGNTFAPRQTPPTWSRLFALQRLQRSKPQALPHTVYHVPTTLPIAPDSEDFHGIVLDTGAPQCVIGKRQYDAYCRKIGAYLQPTASRAHFSFGATSSPPCGVVNIILDTPVAPIRLRTDIVDADVPMLMGLSAMEENQLTINVARLQLTSSRYNWYLPLIRKNFHLYVDQGALTV